MKQKPATKVVLKLIDYCDNISYLSVEADDVRAYSRLDMPMSLGNYVHGTISAQDLRDQTQLALSEGAEAVHKACSNLVGKHYKISIQRVWEQSGTTSSKLAKLEV